MVFVLILYKYEDDSMNNEIYEQTQISTFLKQISKSVFLKIGLQQKFGGNLA